MPGEDVSMAANCNNFFYGYSPLKEVNMQVLVLPILLL